MKIITMQRLTLDGAQVHTDPDNPYEYRDWWCVIETQEEEMVYDLFTTGIGKQYNNIEKLWNNMVKHAGQGMGLAWGDDDLYGYIRPSESVPEIKENFKDGDGDIWVRVQ